MKADLRNLVTAEEAYFADNNTYGGVTSTGDGVASGGNLGAVYSSSAGVSVTATATGGEGFIATATHSGAAGISCQLAVGVSAVAPLVEGEPKCTP